MEIRFDYFLKQDGMTRLMNTVVTENDIVEMLEKKFRDGDLECPIYFDREKVNIEFVVDKIIVQ